MSIRFTPLGLALLACAAPAAAGERAVRATAEAYDLTPREVRMLTGAPTTYAEYRTSYLRARDKMRLVNREGGPEEPAPYRPRPDVEPEPVPEAETFALPEED